MVEGFRVWGVSHKKSIIQASLFCVRERQYPKTDLLHRRYDARLRQTFVFMIYSKFVDALRTHRMF